MAFAALLGVLPPSMITNIDELLPVKVNQASISAYARQKFTFSSSRLSDVLDKAIEPVATAIFALHQTMSIPENLKSREVSFSVFCYI